MTHEDEKAAPKTAIAGKISDSIAARREQTLSDEILALRKKRNPVTAQRDLKNNEGNIAQAPGNAEESKTSPFLLAIHAFLFNPHKSEDFDAPDYDALSEAIGIKPEEYESWHKTTFDENGYMRPEATLRIGRPGVTGAAVFGAVTTAPSRLLDIIGKHESNGDYNVVYGGRRIDLTHMSINEVMAWQKNQINNGNPSSAVGRYQIIHGTMKELRDRLGLTGEEKFDEKMQDKMATVLLERRGLNEYMANRISEDKFMKNLSKEWASLPKDLSGRGYYDGDGLNKAGAKPQEVLAAIRMERETSGPGRVARARDNGDGNNFKTAPVIEDPFKTAASGMQNQPPASDRQEKVLTGQKYETRDFT